MNETIKDSSSGSSRPPSWIRPIVVLLLIGAAAGAYAIWGEHLSLENLARREAALRSYRESHPVLVYGIAFTIYVAVTGFSLPGAIPLSLLFAWFFGFWRGVILVSFASTLGATLAFLLSRYAFRETIQRKFGKRLEAFNRALRRDGAFYLLTLRLIPYVPFFVINLVMGLTPMRVSTYWIVSQIGMLPGTAVYVYAGSRVPDLETLSQNGVGEVLTPQVIIAFILLAIFPLVVKFIVNRIRPRSSDPELDPEAVQNESTHASE